MSEFSPRGGNERCEACDDEAGATYHNDRRK